MNAKSRMSARGGVFALSFFALSLSAFGQSDAVADAFFSRVDKAVVSLAGQSGATAYATCARLVGSTLDIDAMSRGAAGKAWGAMNASQRAAHRAAMARRAARDCVDQNADNTGRPLTFLGVRRGEGGDRLLATRVEQQGQGSHTVIWRLRGARAVDLLVDGRSSVISMREEADDSFDRSNGDVDAVIRSLGR